MIPIENIPEDIRDRKIVEGIVDTTGDHFRITYGAIKSRNDNVVDALSFPTVALVGRGKGKEFIIQYLLKADPSDKNTKEILNEVKENLDFYLVKHKLPPDGDPWRYARYHCGMASNLYADVHWCFYSQGKMVKGSCLQKVPENDPLVKRIREKQQRSKRSKDTKIRK